MLSYRYIMSGSVLRNMTGHWLRKGESWEAVWCRIMEDYGHINDATPSLAISVHKAWRGVGIGTAMMQEMLALLHACGYGQVSLSVDKANYAVRMYLAAGFGIVEERETEYVMVCPLTQGMR